MSKSVGNVVDPFSITAHYGVDPVRYFFMREVSFGQDGVYSHEAIANRINADLANDLGNLAQRSLSMIGRYLEGVVPKPGALTAEDKTLLEAADALLDRCRAEMSQQGIHLALSAIWQVVADANRYFAAQEPWALRKSDPARMGTVLYVTAEVVREIAILVQPVMPASAARLLDLIAIGPEARTFASLGPVGRLSPGATLPAAEPVFPRYVDKDAAPASIPGT
jgi:methionyl-tRNA synthetase